eukprot:3080118-Pleurochrysis_carterae.AAC.1
MGAHSFGRGGDLRAHICARYGAIWGELGGGDCVRACVRACASLLGRRSQRRANAAGRPPGLKMELKAGVEVDEVSEAKAHLQMLGSRDRR